MAFPSYDPTNMNVGDLAGDVFFDLLYTIIFQMACADDQSDANPFCSTFVNKHNTNHDFGNDTVVTKLVLEVNGDYGPYARCMVGDDGDYSCSCNTVAEWWGVSQTAQCSNPAVGREDVNDMFGAGGWGRLCDILVRKDEEVSRLIRSRGDEHSTLLKNFVDFVTEGEKNDGRMLSPWGEKGDDDRKGMRELACTIRKAAEGIGGYWYSPLDIGLQEGTWRTLEMVKRVSRDCHTNSFFSAVEAHAASNNEVLTIGEGYDHNHHGARFGSLTYSSSTEPGISCFDSCVNDDMRDLGQKRNTSSPCWLGCFLDTVLGVTSTNSTASREGGMTREEILGAWSQPFESFDLKDGGCPDYDSQPSFTS